MNELNDIDWSYTIPDGKYFINDDMIFDKSATFRNLKGTFNDPLSSSEEEESAASLKIQNKLLKKQKKKKITLQKQSAVKKNPSEWGCDYIPGSRPIPPIYPQSSCLTIEEQKLCSRVMHFLNNTCLSLPQEHATKKDVETYTALQQNIKAEQKLFNEFVKNEWQTKFCGRHLRIPQTHKKFIDGFWEQSLFTIKKYPQFYQMVCMSPLIYSNIENPVKIKMLCNLHRSGIIPEINLPLLRGYFLPIKTDEVCAIKQVKQNRCVSEDERCESYAIQHKANIVISQNALITLAENVDPYNKTWNIPFSVRKHELIDKDGKPIIHIVVYVDDALPPKIQNVYEKSSWCYNIFLRHSLVKKKCNKKQPKIVSKYCTDCIKYAENPGKKNVTAKNDSVITSSDEETMEIDDTVLETSRSSNKPLTPTRGVTTRGMANKNNITLDEPVNKPTIKISPIKKNLCTCDSHIREMSAKGEDVSDLTNQILTRVKETVNSQEDDESNLTYTLWDIGQSEHEALLSKTAKKNLIVLIRSGVDGHQTGQDGTPQELILAPKVEYQTEFGVECSTASEIARNWTSLYFNPYSQLLRARIIQHSSEIMMFERHSLQSIVKDTTWKPQHALGRFFNVFSSLINLPFGKYLLTHEVNHHSFCMIYKNVPISCENGLDLYQSYNINTSEISLKANTEPWIPIDPSVVTPNHVALGLVPCMFTPGNVKTRKPLLPAVKKKPKGKPARTHRSKFAN